MRLLAAVSAAAVLLGGCGASKSADKPEPAAQKTDEQQIRAVYADFVRGFRERDGALICRASTPEIQAGFISAAAQLGRPSADCVTAFETIASTIPAGEFVLTALRVTGDSATGRNPKATDADDRIVRFARDGGRWLVDG